MKSGGWLAVGSCVWSPGALRTGAINNTALAFGVGSSSLIASSLTHHCTIEREKRILVSSPDQRLSNHSLATVTRHGRSGFGFHCMLEEVSMGLQSEFVSALDLTCRLTETISRAKTD